MNARSRLALRAISSRAARVMSSSSPHGEEIGGRLVRRGVLTRQNSKRSGGVAAAKSMASAAAAGIGSWRDGKSAATAAARNRRGIYW